ncbi:vacuolar membrane protein [Coprinopsis sp. MPI-PUGE-AT-0042]|nr:vacuolar membrane protein [Coprinopsis sp. MPI-PUGE-AT-0042]
MTSILYQHSDLKRGKSYFDEGGHVPTLKRSSTTSGSGSRSHRNAEMGTLSTLLPIPPSPTGWGTPGTSLLSQAATPHLRRFFSESLPMAAAAHQVAVDPPQSPDGLADSKGRALNFIDMSPLVGDAVGNMSISPSRKGLYIIDLENTEKRPRFLPQGGTWDVADVQWNPHPSHSQYIVSTSSEKMLIWNLGITGRSAIEHVLKSHYRAITDFNWHTTECDIVASTGIDSWIWVWDLRNPRKAGLWTISLQGRWNASQMESTRPNVLASAHGNEVLIWDRRRGSRAQRNPWLKSRRIIPVWRARNLLLGKASSAFLNEERHGSRCMQGANDLPRILRSSKPSKATPTSSRNSCGGRPMSTNSKLVTWSKDRTLRFWPVGSEVMKSVGHMPEIAPSFSYRDVSEGIAAHTRTPQLLSAPIGNRSILAEVRAGAGPYSPNLITQPHTGSSARGLAQDSHRLSPTASGATPTEPVSRARGGTMSRGAVTGKSVAGIEPVAWLSHVKVAKRGSSSGAGSAEPGSTSRASSIDTRGEDPSVRNRSVSRSRATEDGREGDGGPSLQDECHDLTKKRTVTLGLHGPWGESSSVFMRVTFTFPPKYPMAPHPEGTPSVDLERSPLVSQRDRAYVLKRLKVIRENESDLAWKLVSSFFHPAKDGRMLDSESSDDDVDNVERKKKKGKGMTVSILRTHKNMAEPRTSQGSFGPNGELICFFRSAPRRVVQRTILRGVPETSSEDHTVQEQKTPAQESLQQSRLFQSPALVSDAVRRLRFAASDQPAQANNGEGDFNILRTMTNLLTVSQDRIRPGTGGNSRNWPFQPVLRSSIFMSDTINGGGPDRSVAMLYAFTAETLGQICEHNAFVARECGRYDHERVFRMLRSLFKPYSGREDAEDADDNSKSFVCDRMGLRIVERLYDKLAAQKDIQMLAMVSIMMLQTPQGSRKVLPKPTSRPKPEFRIAEPPPLKKTVSDYFALDILTQCSQSALSQLGFSRRPICYTHSCVVDQLPWFLVQLYQRWKAVCNGIQEGLTTPTEYPAPLTEHGEAGPEHCGALQKRRVRKDSSKQVSPASVTSKSWSDGQPPSRTLSISFSSAGHKRSGNLRVTDISPSVQEKRRIVFNPDFREEESPAPGFSDALIMQFHQHVYLFTQRLELLKAAEELRPSLPLNGSQHLVGVIRRCARSGCGAPLDNKLHCCSICGTPASKPACTICRLPVKGLSRNCLRCLHVTHISCWNKLDVPICPTGCGCFCSPLEGIYTRPSTRMGFSPMTNSLMLSASVV